jgi:hypothetical protein
MTIAVTQLASRPVSTARAIRIAYYILAAIALLAIGKALLAQASAAPAAEAVVVRASAEAAEAPRAQRAAGDDCRLVEVEIDEGYGVRGHVTRKVCRKVF